MKRMFAFYAATLLILAAGVGVAAGRLIAVSDEELLHEARRVIPALTRDRCEKIEITIDPTLTGVSAIAGPGCQVRFSQHDSPRTWPRLNRVILHEAAHLRVGGIHGHDSMWRSEYQALLTHER